MDSRHSIYFCFSRKGCEILANRIQSITLVDSEKGQEIISYFDGLVQLYGLGSDDRTAVMRDLVKNGIAYHHAGMHPMLKEVVEQLFTHRLVEVIFTTETFALGINMPARTVVLDGLKRQYGRYHRILKTRDFYQMAGRSGRRGIDSEGFVYSRIDPADISYNELGNILNNQPEAIQSRFSASYAFILSLYELYGEELFQIYSYSLHHFQNREDERGQPLKEMKRKLKVLKRLGYIDDYQLTRKAHFAKKMYGYELPLAELYGSGFLEKLTVRQLAVLSLAAVFEPRPNEKKPRIPRDIRKLWSTTMQLKSFIHETEKKFTLPTLSKPFHFDLSNSLHAWMDQRPFSEIMDMVPGDEGETIRYYRMCLQVLRDMLQTPISDQLKDKIHRAVSMINRDEIDAEAQLSTIVSHGETEELDIQDPDSPGNG